ncbi:MAG TPA: AMP-binding protein [Steroidobacter sp.]|uniref:class I adenylate-forming enzyme family protein n=1 Tax=Steroidobacter sp. TaxID=1978227 RepID=UPI002EDB2E0A
MSAQPVTVPRAEAMAGSLGEMLSASAERFGDKLAVIAIDRQLSFRDLERLSSRLARALVQQGLRRGDRVTLWVENGWRWMVAYYAVLKLGGVVNPCNILLTADEVAYIAGDCGARMVIAGRDKVDTLAGRLTATLIADQPCDGPLDLDTLLGERESDEYSSFSSLEPLDIATIAYTSGTTGRPKGAVLSHSTILMNTAMTSLMHGRTSSDCVVSALPCTHVYGNVVMNSAVMCGMTLVLLPRFDESAVLQAIQRHRATLFEGVPTMFYRLLNCELERFDLTSLRVCTVGGQTMPVAKMVEVERRFACPLLELWGMTELGGLGTTHPHNGPRRLGSIGIALPYLQTRVVALDDPSRVLPDGEIGELLVRGPLLMQGYLDNPAATSETILDDGWMRTGDLVRSDSDGYLYVVDRAKEVIISGGYNIYPAELERVIAQHPSVAMVAVAAMPDELRGQAPKAFVVARDGMSCSAEDIIEHCRPLLAGYKLPRAVELLDDLPKTSTGKILRRALATSTI